MKHLVFLLFVVLFFCLPVKVHAALSINEFSSSTSGSDWVEIYNSDSASVDLSSYILRDSTDSNKLDLTGLISGNGFTTFEWSNKLNNDGDTIKLLKTDESSVDQIVYGSGGSISAPTGTQTAGRSSDASSNWVLFTNDTKGSSNNSGTVAPTPTSAPTATPTVAPSPTPTKTPTPTLAPSNSPTPTKATTPTPSGQASLTPKVTTSTSLTGIPPTPTSAIGVGSLSSNNEKQDDVLGANSNLAQGSKGFDNSYNWGKLFIIMGVVLVAGACGLLLYNNYKKKKGETIEGSL